MQCSRWEPADQITGPCADISFTYATREAVTATLHFSQSPGLPNRDLQLTFNGVLSLLWELEGPGVSAMPRNLPRFTALEWQHWTFPLLQVAGSEWLGRYQAIYPSTPCRWRISCSCRPTTCCSWSRAPMHWPSGFRAARTGRPSSAGPERSLRC